MWPSGNLVQLHAASLYGVLKPYRELLGGVLQRLLVAHHRIKFPDPGGSMFVRSCSHWFDAKYS